LRNRNKRADNCCNQAKQGVLPHVDSRKRNVCSLQLDCYLLLYSVTGCQPGDLERCIPGRWIPGKVRRQATR
jgi:hypothetical protein